MLMEKTKKKLQTTIIMLFIILVTFCCLLVPEKAHAQTAQQNIKALNLENTNEEIDFKSIENENGIIVNMQCLKNNIDVFKKYIQETDGTVLIADRNNESNILAYQILNIDDKYINVYPLYLYNKIDKNELDYQEVFQDVVLATSSVTDGDAYDFMTTTDVSCIF